MHPPRDLTFLSELPAFLRGCLPSSYPTFTRRYGETNRCHGRPAGSSRSERLRKRRTQGPLESALRLVAYHNPHQYDVSDAISLLTLSGAASLAFQLAGDGP